MPRTYSQGRKARSNKSYRMNNGYRAYPKKSKHSSFWHPNSSYLGYKLPRILLIAGVVGIVVYGCMSVGFSMFNQSTADNSPQPFLSIEDNDTFSNVYVGQEIAELYPVRKRMHLLLDEEGRKAIRHLINDEPQAKTIYTERLSMADQLLSKNPAPAKNLHLEGNASSDVLYKQSVDKLKDVAVIRDLGFLYAVSGDVIYRDKAYELISSWSSTYIPDGNPINESHLVPLLEGYDLIKDGLTPKQSEPVDVWLETIAEAEIKYKLSGATAVNNWQSHRISLIGLIGYVTGSDRYVTYSHQAYKTHLDKTFDPDGSSYDFQQRDSMTYHNYGLTPLLRLARTATLHGESIYSFASPRGSTLSRAIDFLVPYANGSKIHYEKVNSKVPYDKQRAVASTNNQDQIGILYKPQDSLSSLSIAYFFNPSLLDTINKAGGYDSRYPTVDVLLSHALAKP